jgi:hypothetical protein
MKNSYIINKTFEINELQYFVLYFHGCYHFDTWWWTCIENSYNLNHSWLRCEDTSSRHLTQPISSHIVLGQPHVPGNKGTLAVSWDMSGTCPGHFHLREWTLLSWGTLVLKADNNRQAKYGTMVPNFWQTTWKGPPKVPTGYRHFVWRDMSPSCTHPVWYYKAI